MAAAALGISKGVLCNTVEVVQKFADQYELMVQSQEICRNTLENLRTLLDLLRAVEEKLDLTSVPVEVSNAIERIRKTFTEYEKTFFKETEKSGLCKFIRPKKGQLQQMQTTTTQCTAALNTALQVAVKHNLESMETSLKQGKKFRSSQFSPLIVSRRKPSALSEIKINQPGYQNDGAVILSWKDANLPGTVKKYEFEFWNVKSQSVHKCEFDASHRQYRSEPLTFIPLQTYRVKARAKGAIGYITSDWSAEVIVRVPKAPPSRPPCGPEFIKFFCSHSENYSSDSSCCIDSVQLQVPYPSEGDCNGSPLKEFSVVYFDENATLTSSLTKCPTPGVNERETIDIHGLDFDLQYTFSFAWVNKCGKSEQSASVKVRKSDAIPGPPASIRQSTKKRSDMLKIRWEKPLINSFAVHHYEVHMKQKDGSFVLHSETKKCSATIRNLSQSTEYLFRVRSVNGNELKSNFTDDIIVHTRLSNAVKGVLGGVGAAGGVVGGVVGGAVSGPIVGVTLGAMAGQAAANRVKNKVGKAVVGTLAGVAAGIPGTLVGTVLTPFTMIAAPITLAATAGAIAAEEMEDNWSDQSSDEEGS